MLKEVAGFAEKEIENVQYTRNPSSWNDTFEGNKERWCSTETKIDFLFFFFLAKWEKKNSWQVYEAQ